MYQNVHGNLLQKTSVYRNGLYISVCNSRNIVEFFFRCGAILKATNSSFQKAMIFCRSIFVKKVMKLLAFIFEQPSYKYLTKVADIIILRPGHIVTNTLGDKTRYI